MTLKKKPTICKWFNFQSDLLSRLYLCYENVLLEISVTTAFAPKHDEEI